MHSKNEDFYEYDEQKEYFCKSGVHYTLSQIRNGRWMIEIEEPKTWQFLENIRYFYDDETKARQLFKELEKNAELSENILKTYLKISEGLSEELLEEES